VLRSKKHLKLVAFLLSGLIASVILSWHLNGSIWTTLDYQALDIYFRQIVKFGYGPDTSDQIVYLTITDDTYQDFNQNILDRAYLAKVNQALAQLAPETVAYDIIFARPSSVDADQQFKQSVEALGNVYLPMAMRLSNHAIPFRWQEGRAFARFKAEFLKKPQEKGSAQPFYGKDAIMQMDDFVEAERNTGHITTPADPDGVYRHAVMLVKVDSLYIPTLALSMFLDYVEIVFEDISVHWGKEIRIPATEDSYLEDEVVIPIDEGGRAYIPFAQVWNHGFKQMTAHNLLKRIDNTYERGNLIQFFQGKFVFIGDISSGTSDSGKIPLMDRAPLLSTHASLMNGFLTNTFFRKWTFWQGVALICGVAILLGLCACIRSSWILYSAGILIFIGVLAFTWLQFIHFTLFPVVSVGASSIFIFFGLIVGLQITIKKEAELYRLRYIELGQKQSRLIQSEKIAALAKLTAGVAHEINSPIGAIKSNADVIVRCVAKLEEILGNNQTVTRNPSYQKTFRILKENIQTSSIASERISEIVSSLKNFTRLDEAEFAEVSIHEGLDSTLILIQHEIKDGINVIKQYGDIPEICCYASELNQVFMTLLRNAARAIEQKGQITIKTWEDNKHVCVGISDTGKGIPPEKVKNIFDVSFITKNSRIGMDMGLINVYNIMQKHHGEIKIASEVDKGSTFTLSLPTDLKKTFETAKSC